MVVPCLLMGMAFPLAGEARARLDLRFGEAVGDLVGLNTIGAILGSLLAGFVLIPQLGLQRSMLLASAAYLGYGLLVLCAAWGAERPKQRALAWAGAAASLPLAIGRTDAIHAKEYGQFEVYACKKCGLAELYVLEPDKL